LQKSSLKCKENRQQRREEVARIAKAQALVNEAKKKVCSCTHPYYVPKYQIILLFQANPLEAMEAFLKFNKNAMEVAITFYKAPELDQALQEKIMDLMKLNMQTV
jgi:hypothetical protein